MQEIINNVTFSDVLQTFVDFFQKQYGELKAKEISIKVYTSKKVNKFLSETNYRKIKPGTTDYLTVIHSSTNFTFSNAETISFASVMLLHKWNIDVGIPNNLSTDYYLNTVFFSLLKKCDNFKTHISGHDNFFSRFNDYVTTAF
jgi:hypothetical protein